MCVYVGEVNIKMPLGLLQTSEIKIKSLYKKTFNRKSYGNVLLVCVLNGLDHYRELKL